MRDVEGGCHVGLPGRFLHAFKRTAVRSLERAEVPRSAAAPRCPTDSLQEVHPETFPERTQIER
jgi:hypothetical protein